MNGASMRRTIMSRKRLIFTCLCGVLCVELIVLTVKSVGNFTTELSARRYRVNKTAVLTVNCRALFENDTAELEKAKNVLKQQPPLKNTTQLRDLIDRASDCESYVADTGYITNTLTDKEANFPIAYSIVMHKDVQQVELLLRAIYRPQNVYCIHVDNKSIDSVHEAMSSVAKCFPNVFVSEKRISVVWGEISVLEVELICIRELLKRSAKWKYFINLTGQEFPLRTNGELVDVLEAFNGATNAAGDHSSEWTVRFKDGGPVPHGLSPAKGSLHIVANRAFVDFVVNDRRAKDLFNWTSRTFIPDETFFPTIYLSPELKIPGSYKYADFDNGTFDQYIMRYKEWEMYATCKGQVLRDVCTLGVDYLPELSMARELFANKFIWDYDRLGVQCLDELLTNRTFGVDNGDYNFGGEDTAFNASWYSTLNFVVDKI